MITVIEKNTTYKMKGYQLPDDNYFIGDGVLTIDFLLQQATFVFTPENYTQVFRNGLKFETFFKPSMQFSFAALHQNVGVINILENGDLQYECFIETYVEQ